MLARTTSLVTAINRMAPGKVLGTSRALLSALSGIAVRERAAERMFTEHSVTAALARAVELELLDPATSGDGSLLYRRSAAVFEDVDLQAAVQTGINVDPIEPDVVATILSRWEGVLPVADAEGASSLAHADALLAAIYDRKSFVWSELDYARLLRVARGESVESPLGREDGRDVDDANEHRSNE